MPKVEEKKQTQRLDKWLKISRLFKTRTISSDACEARHVKVNNISAKPGKFIKPGDELIIRKDGRYRSFIIKELCHRSISAKLAVELYEETTEAKLTPEEKEMIAITRKTAPRYERKYEDGRPTKKEGRAIRKLKGF